MDKLVKDDQTLERQPWSMQKTPVLVIGLIFHLIYILSVFDCYFTSPVVHGMRHFNHGDAEAKRLVLFVGDGLRADLLYNQKPFPSIPDSPEIVAPYLHQVARERGAFGVSHTHVPTESRPGHVAIIAGMYEDVSAVTKGWKTNPVDFDSVFNQSSHTFSFGSPDILPMFSRGADPGRVKTWSYDEEDEDFTRDATELDTWVLEQLRHLLKNASTDGVLDAELRGGQTVFFLHLLGLDTTGHSYRPHSPEYMHNIQVVDDIVRQTESLFEDFFGDNKTAFVFTADHGMSNIGNHGDGHPDNTRTPLIAWGAGVRGPLPLDTPSDDDYSASWPAELRSLERHDVEQADIAPLMAALLGINFPANSVGVLPDVDIDKAGYLKLADGDLGKAKLAIINAKSILEQFRVNHRIKASRKLFYEPFPGLSTQDKYGDPGSNQLLLIEQLLSIGKWIDARKEAASLIRLALEGLRYLQTYDRMMLQEIVYTGYLGWCAFSALSIFAQPQSTSSKLSGRGRFVIISSALAILSVFYVIFALQGEPWTYYLYVAFPCFFWCEVFLSLARQGILPSRRRFWFEQQPQPPRKPWRIALLDRKGVRTCLMACFTLQLMVAAYKTRAIWSILFAFGGVIWPYFSWPERLNKEDPLLRVKWAITCLICAIFPLRNVEQSENITTVVTGGCALIVVGLACVYRLQRCGHRVDLSPAHSQIVVIAISIIITMDSVLRLRCKNGLPLYNQILGWSIIVSSVLLPALLRLHSHSPSTKLLVLFLTFSPCFVILSICAEGWFYLSYCATLIMWVEVEGKLRHALEMDKLGYLKEAEARDKAVQNAREALAKHEYTPQADDVRIAIFFLFFVQVAFFGTGNVASISSFYLEPVYRLVPIFSPFIMAALLIFKILAPYVILSAALAQLNAKLNMPPFSLFLIALSLTDVMTIMFFRQVTDTGSWLEIGQSISFFVIASLLLVWTAGICALGEWLMRPSHGPSFGELSSATVQQQKTKAE